MNWQNNVLFHLKFSNGLISRRNLEGLLMNGVDSYEKSTDRLKILIEEDLLVRTEDGRYPFKLSRKADLRITPFFESATFLMKQVEKKLKKLTSHIDFIQVKGGTIGLYFTYTKMSMFGFYPKQGKTDIILLVKLPNLIGEEIEYKSNKFYLSKETLNKTNFLEAIVNAHLNMIDDFYIHEA